MRPALGVHTMNATVGVADAPLGDSVWKSQLSKVLSSPLPARVSCYFPYSFSSLKLQWKSHPPQTGRCVLLPALITSSGNVRSRPLSAKCFGEA